MKRERILYPVSRFDDVQLVLGWQVSEHFAARSAAGWWGLDHLPSGYFIPRSQQTTLAKAAALATKLDACADFSRRDGWVYTDAELSRIASVLGYVPHRFTEAEERTRLRSASGRRLIDEANHV